MPAPCDDLACMVCDVCTAPRDSVTAADEPSKAKPKDRKRSGYQTQIADAALVYVLGDVPQDNGGSVRQIDVFSGINSHLVRTLPGKRWQHPIMIGAGGGFLAVVDRCASQDVIRITDKYAGAGASAFDAHGSPKDSVDWAKIADLCRVVTPAGTHCTGLKVLPRGILIAFLTDSQGQARYMTADITGRIQGTPSRAFERDLTLPEPLCTIGAFTANPHFIEAKPTSNMFHFIGLLSGPSYAAAVIVDALRNKVTGILGLPAGLTPMGITYSEGVVSVLCGNGSYGTKVVRFLVENTTFMMTGLATKHKVPSPETYTVTEKPTYKDFERHVGETESGLRITTYLQIAQVLNEKPSARTIPAISPEGESSDSDILNDDRSQAKLHLSSNYYNVTVPVEEISVPESLKLKAIDGGYGCLGELFNRTDTAKPIFRLVHASHYDWINEGGFSYGCQSHAGVSVGLTSGMIGSSIAVDKDYDLGVLQEKDLKACLVDRTTGLLIYRMPKSLGMKVYAGHYAGLEPSAGTPVGRTTCTEELEAIAEGLDGIERPELRALRSGDDPVPAYSESLLDLDEPWAFYLRRPKALKKTILVPKRASWTTYLPEGDKAPEWEDGANPLESSIMAQVLWPPKAPIDPPSYTCSGYGGYFAIDWPMTGLNGEWTFSQDRLRQFEVGLSTGQSLDPATGSYTLETVEPFPSGMTPWLSFPIGEDAEVKRACVVQPDIYAWIGLDVKLIADDMDGVGIYSYPETRRNGLGHKVGVLENMETTYAKTFGITDGSVWEGGWRSYWDQGGASARWGYKIIPVPDSQLMPDGVSTETLRRCLVEASSSMVQALAPEDMKNVLQTLSTGMTPDPAASYCQVQKAFVSRIPLKGIIVQFFLYNLATDVFRFGYRTINFGDSRGDSPICPKVDRGYHAGDNCEASACGNLTCASQQFGNMHKLYSTDQLYPKSRQIVVSGAARFDFPDEDPYYARGLLYGRAMICEATFNLNASVKAYDVNIQPGG